MTSNGPSQLDRFKKSAREPAPADDPDPSNMRAGLIAAFAIVVVAAVVLCLVVTGFFVWISGPP